MELAVTETTGPAVPANLPVASVRMLDTAENATTSWVSAEFFSMATSIVVNLITAATVVGWVDASQAQELAKAATAIIAAVSAICVNGFIVWKYIGGRQSVEREKVLAQYRYAEVVAVEEYRLTAEAREAFRAAEAKRRRAK